MALSYQNIHIITNMSITNLFRNFQNIQQIRNKPNPKRLTSNQPLTEHSASVKLEKPEKIAFVIKEMQSKIEEFQNMMKKKLIHQQSSVTSNKSLNSRRRQMSNGRIETITSKRQQKQHAKQKQIKDLSYSIKRFQQKVNNKRSNDSIELKKKQEKLAIKQIETNFSLKNKDIFFSQRNPQTKLANILYSPTASSYQRIKKSKDIYLGNMNDSLNKQSGKMFLRLINCDANKQLYNHSPLDVLQTQTEQKRINNNNANNTIAFEQINNFPESLEHLRTNKKPNIIQGFQFGRVLGRGKFGEVYLARHLQTGFIVAIKKFVKSKLKENNMVNQFIEQIKLHNSFDHPKIEKDSIYLVLQYMNGGTLFQHLSKIGSLGVKEAVDFLRDIIEAMMYLHQKFVAHRDIKSENIVINSGIAKLCDFGWSALVESARDTFCGTLDYVSPEILQHKAYDWSVDIWSIGILTYQLFIGNAPFKSKDRIKVMQNIVNIDITGIPMIQTISEQARQFIEALLQKDPSKRPKIHELLNFPLFTNHTIKRKNRNELA